MAIDLFYEIGTEEIPAGYINNAISDIKRILKQNLENLRIEYEDVLAYATPRRFAILVKNISERQTDFEEVLKGPSIKIAFDKEGNPSKALTGFVKSKGGELENVEFIEVNGEEYAHLKVFSEGKETESFAKELLENVIRNINFPKPMKWGNKNIKFIRPIRWLICFLGEKNIDFDIEEIRTSNLTKGHRFLGKSEIEVRGYDDYNKKLEENFVILNHFERKQIIKSQVEEVAKSLNGVAIIDEDILDEVNFIVEYPTAFYGTFDENYLNLPEEVVITPMKNHQRYFPVVDKTGKLMNYFITVRNGDSHMIDNVRKGNQRVLDARLKDAQFFYEEDIKKPLADYVENLKTIVFHQKLGSVYDKIERIKKSAFEIAEKLNFRTENIERTVVLSKADLTTQMVFEFGELQGIMGRYYAIKSGEKQEVCDGIFEHYLPRSADDEIAKTPEGISVSLADKIDTVVGFFSIGIQPSGSQDPYALRRQAIAILSTLIERKLDISVSEIVNIAKNSFNFGVSEETLEDVIAFLMLRLNNILLDMGIRYDVVNSIKHHTNIPVYKIVQIADAVEMWLSEDKSIVLTTLLRGKNLISKDFEREIQEELFEHETEKHLHDVILNNRDNINNLIEGGNYFDALVATEIYVQVINNLFDNVMIMHKDEKIKSNRLSLIANALEGINKILDIDQIIFK